MGNPWLRQRLEAGEFVVAPGGHDMITAVIARDLGFECVYATGYWMVASAYGLLRVFDDAHPALGDWAREALGAVPATPAAPVRAPVPSSVARPRSTPSMALTPKEREVLELAARNLSNKEIGLAMQVGEETIKWHMKNLFAKLDAGTRRQVVSRARILGLLADATP